MKTCVTRRKFNGYQIFILCFKIFKCIFNVFHSMFELTFDNCNLGIYSSRRVIAINCFLDVRLKYV